MSTSPPPLLQTATERGSASAASPTGPDDALLSPTVEAALVAGHAPLEADIKDGDANGGAPAGRRESPARPRARRWHSYLRTREFWAVLVLGQVLSLCITATNTFTTFLSRNHTNVPAFQTLFTYILVCLASTPVFLARAGGRRWVSAVRRHGWRYFVLAFLDVQGNYFTVLAYRFTNILSAQLINFWSIVCVVAVSFAVLRVRYGLFQVLGILICCGGMGLLLASDHISSDTGAATDNMLKGDLFGLLGATCYGLSNVFEEFMVSKRPVYEVLALLSLFGAAINGVQAAIFDRDAVRAADWSGPAAGHLVGYTLCLALFYATAPLVLRMGSAAFFDISLLTANFWGVIIGTRVFGFAVHYLYPPAFVLVVAGLVAYFLSGAGDSEKPWLGERQEGGVDGLGTARRRVLAGERRGSEDVP